MQLLSYTHHNIASLTSPTRLLSLRDAPASAMCATEIFYAYIIFCSFTLYYNALLHITSLHWITLHFTN